MVKVHPKPRTAAKVTGDLTEKEALFVDHYLGAASGNGRKAAAMAGYTGNDKQLRSTAYQILRRERVIDVMTQARERRSAIIDYTADDVLRELLQLLAETKALPTGVARARAVLAILDKIGEHIAVGAFRRQVGLSNPQGGPIETVDVAELKGLTEEELDYIDKARTALDRAADRNPHAGSDRPGEGAPADPD